WPATGAPSSFSSRGTTPAVSALTGRRTRTSPTPWPQRRPRGWRYQPSGAGWIPKPFKFWIEYRWNWPEQAGHQWETGWGHGFSRNAVAAPAPVGVHAQPGAGDGAATQRPDLSCVC